MTRLQKSLIGGMLAVAVGTDIYQAHRASALQHQLQTLQQQQVPLTEQLQQLTGANSTLSNQLLQTANKRFQWASVESADYKQYMANLRAIGCPEQTIRDIVLMDLDRTYGQRMAGLNSASDKNYWREPNPIARARDELEGKRIEEEKYKVIRGLLGIDADEEAGRRVGRSVAYETGYEFLSADKRQRLREIDYEYKMKLAPYAGVWSHLLVRDLQAAAISRREIEEWKESAIKNLLTPEELNEYEMRQGRHAHGLRWALNAFEPTEQEFRSIFQIQKQFGKPDAVTGFFQPPDDPAIKQQFQAALKQALGEQRYAEYKRSRDPCYGILYGIVRDTELPKETMQTAYDLHRAAEQRGQAIRKDTSLSPEARQAAFQRLVDQTDREMARLLGESGFRLYRYRIGMRWR